jgi:hypothetical protein
MRKSGKCVLLGIIVAAAAVLVCLYAIPAESMAAQVDENLAKIMKGIDANSSAAMSSSNPYDYTRDNDSFEKIVSMGYDALPVLEQGLRSSDQDGLREYIMCIAIERITNCNLKQFDDCAWDRASVFKGKWNQYLKDLPGRVRAAMQGGETGQPLVDSLVKLGGPAVPYIVQFSDLLDEGDGKAVAQAMEDELQGSQPGDSVGAFKTNNSELIARVESYVENR